LSEDSNSEKKSESNKDEEISIQNDSNDQTKKVDDIVPAKIEKKPTDKRITIIKDVIFHPVLAFREIDGNSNFYLAGAIAIFLANAGFFSEGFFEGLGSMAGEIAFIGLALYIGRFLKGKANFRGFFSVFQYAGIPALVGSAILWVIPENELENLFAFQSENNPIMISLLGIAIITILWSLILTILAIRESHKFSTGRSIGTIIISFIIVMIIVVPIVISLGLAGEF